MKYEASLLYVGAKEKGFARTTPRRPLWGALPWLPRAALDFESLLGLLGRFCVPASENLCPPHIYVCHKILKELLFIVVVRLPQNPNLRLLSVVPRLRDIPLRASSSRARMRPFLSCECVIGVWFVVVDFSRDPQSALPVGIRHEYFEHVVEQKGRKVYSGKKGRAAVCLCLSRIPVG